MRLIHIPTFWTVLLDVAVWFVIHMGVVLVMLALPERRFNPRGWLFRERAWEDRGALYTRLFRIRSWKERLPDGAAFIRWRGFPKKRLGSRSPGYYSRFLRETCRAELTHWAIMLFGPIFFLWNPLWVGFFMIAYAVAENLPLIMAQRYNRCRLRRVLESADRQTHSSTNG
jgi:glycosyl-4,4'-diaponeurosporenoate acyltransferase